MQLNFSRWYPRNCMTVAANSFDPNTDCCMPHHDNSAPGKTSNFRFVIVTRISGWHLCPFDIVQLAGIRIGISQLAKFAEHTAVIFGRWPSTDCRYAEHASVLQKLGNLANNLTTCGLLPFLLLLFFFFATPRRHKSHAKIGIMDLDYRDDCLCSSGVSISLTRP